MVRCAARSPRGAVSPRCRRRGCVSGSPAEAAPPPALADPAAGALPTTAAPGTRVAGQKGKVRGARGLGGRDTAAGRGLPGCPSHLESPHSPLFPLYFSPRPQMNAERARLTAALRHGRAAAALLGGSTPPKGLPGPGAERRGGFPAALRASAHGGPLGPGASAGSGAGGRGAEPRGRRERAQL